MTEFTLTPQQADNIQNKFRRCRNIQTVIVSVVLVAFIVGGVLFTIHVARMPGLIMTIFCSSLGTLALFGSVKNTRNGYWDNLAILKFFAIKITTWEERKVVLDRGNVVDVRWVYTFTYINEAGVTQTDEWRTAVRVKDFGSGDTLIVIQNANGAKERMPQREFNQRYLGE
ncbi:MAG: hypothetical protein FWE24_04205 [Defluviitaleaceae bacterium]|nr:hypothetical protein [Defluviitaleaceae bacterium]